MRTASRAALAAALAAALGVGCVGCAAPGGSGGAEAAPATLEEAAADAAQPTEPAGTAEADASSQSSQGVVATFDGPKCIVSARGDAGAGETCVVDASSLGAQAASIEWGRTFIALRDVPLEVGAVSYRFAYVDDADLAGDGAVGIANEDAYFASLGLADVAHVEIGGHQVAYAVRQPSAEADAGAIFDLEAAADGYVAEGDADDAASRATDVFVFELRGDGCAFLSTITVAGTDGPAPVFDAEQLVCDAYGLVSFAGAEEKVDAPSYTADLEIVDANGSVSWQVARDGRELLTYEPHRVVLLDPTGTEATGTIVYDFLASGDAPADAGDYEVAGCATRAVVDGNILHAWVDVSGSTLHVEAPTRASEDAQAALARVLGD